MSKSPKTRTCFPECIIVPTPYGSYTQPLLTQAGNRVIIRDQTGAITIEIAPRRRSARQLDVVCSQRHGGTCSALHAMVLDQSELASLFWSKCPKHGLIPQRTIVLNPNGGQGYCLPIPAGAHEAVAQLFLN